MLFGLGVGRAEVLLLLPCKMHWSNTPSKIGLNRETACSVTPSLRTYLTAVTCTFATDSSCQICAASLNFTRPILFFNTIFHFIQQPLKSEPMLRSGTNLCFCQSKRQRVNDAPCFVGCWTVGLLAKLINGFHVPRHLQNQPVTSHQQFLLHYCVIF